MLKTRAGGGLATTNVELHAIYHVPQLLNWLLDIFLNACSFCFFNLFIYG